MKAPAVSSVSAGRKNNTWGRERKNDGRLMGWGRVAFVSLVFFDIENEVGKLYLMRWSIFACSYTIVCSDMESW